MLPLAPFLCLAVKPPRTPPALQVTRLQLTPLPAGSRFVGVKQRTPRYIRVSRRPWWDAAGLFSTVASAEAELTL